MGAALNKQAEKPRTPETSFYTGEKLTVSEKYEARCRTGVVMIG